MIETILLGILKSVGGPLFAIVASYLFWKFQERRTYGGWKVVVKNGDTILCTRPVGGRKAKEVMDDISTLSVFLKGIVSPFGWVNLDLVSDEAKNLGLFKEDKKAREWVIDLAHNPPSTKKPPQG